MVLHGAQRARANCVEASRRCHVVNCVGGDAYLEPQTTACKKHTRYTDVLAELTQERRKTCNAHVAVLSFRHSRRN